MKKVKSKARNSRSIIYICALFVTSTFSVVIAQKDYGIHDPCNIVKDGDTYYTFYTSMGVECAHSTDLCTWTRGGRVFSSG